MDKEKLFAELCATAPAMPPDWAPEGRTRLYAAVSGTARAQAEVLAAAQGFTGKGMAPRERAVALHALWKQECAKQTAEYEPMWRVHYAQGVLAAWGGR